MKIAFIWPFKEKINSSFTESYEFFTALKNKENVELVEDLDEADWIIYMMDIRECWCRGGYKTEKLDQDIVKKIQEKRENEVIVDYNDWTDIRVGKDSKWYFKRSIVDKDKFKQVKYDREIIPISYGIRSDFISYDSKFGNIKHVYDFCCIFNEKDPGNRGLISKTLSNLKGKKYIGRISKSSYGKVEEKYYNILKTSKIIVTANPKNWEGDFRLWEALLMGNLVMCDEMITTHIIDHPLVEKKHIIYYKNMDDLKNKIDYYLKNESEREIIAKEGRNFCLKYHKFSDRVDEVLNKIMS